VSVIVHIKPVLPAGAGVILITNLNEALAERAPRRCGGDPGSETERTY